MSDPVIPDTGQAPLDYFDNVEKQLLQFTEQVKEYHEKHIKWYHNEVLILKKMNGNTRLSSIKRQMENFANTILNECEKLLISGKEHDTVVEALVYSARNKEKALESSISGKEKEIVSLKQELLHLKAAKFDQLVSSQSKQHVIKTSPKADSVPSYAQVTSSSANSPPAKTNHVVIIGPVDDLEVTNSENVYKLFTSKIDHKVLKDNKISIRSKKLTTKNRVVLTCGSSEQCKALCDSLATVESIKASIPKKKLPKVQILGVQETIPKKEIFETIVAQNGLEEYSKSKFQVKFEKNDRLGTKFVVAEVEPKLFKKLMELKKICIGYTSCPVKCCVRVIRCYKCNRFGHCQKDCRNSEMCASCAGAHDTKNCKTPGVKCANCSWVNEKRKQRNQAPIPEVHRADCHDCPQYIRMLRIVENQFDFG